MGSYARSDFLFAQPSVATGVARLFDLWGWFDVYNVSRTPEQADARALYSDWAITGQELKRAIVRFGRSFPEQGELFAVRHHSR